MEEENVSKRSGQLQWSLPKGRMGKTNAHGIWGRELITLITVVPMRTESRLDWVESE